MNEAERLADALDNAPVGNIWTEKAAAELRRLVAINAELVEALELCEKNVSSLLASNHPKVYGTWLDCIRESIKKAKQ